MSRRAEGFITITLVCAVALLLFHAVGGSSLVTGRAAKEGPLPSRVSIHGTVAEVTDDCLVMVERSTGVVPARMVNCIPVGDGTACAQRLRELVLGKYVRMVVLLNMIPHTVDSDGLPSIIVLDRYIDVANQLRDEELAVGAPDVLTEFPLK